MELRHLRYFVAVGEALNVGRAAAVLHIAQPPLSRAIRAFEEELGVELFRRGARGVALTRAGSALLPEARRLLRDAEALRENARQYAAGEAGTLAIGFVSTASYNVLPRIVPAFRARRPGVRLALRETTSDVQMPALVAGDLDVGFLVAGPLPQALAYVPLHREPLIAALPARRRWPSRVPLRRLAGESFILFPREVAPGWHDAIVALCRSAGFSPQVGQEAIQMQTIVSLVAGGMGVSLVPASLGRLRRDGVVYRALAERSPDVETGLAWRAADDSPLTRAFIGEARAASIPVPNR
ncbi:MAG TPA: LysR family transcriptional regulator [Casimicrobiaceae bacterium]|nr:LysR family transcriptional regulator [Casimicrobiaceae bacterium]